MCLLYACRPSFSRNQFTSGFIIRIWTMTLCFKELCMYHRYMEFPIYRHVSSHFAIKMFVYVFYGYQIFTLVVGVKIKIKSSAHSNEKVPSSYLIFAFSFCQSPMHLCLRDFQGADAKTWRLMYELIWKLLLIRDPSCLSYFQ